MNQEKERKDRLKYIPETREFCEGDREKGVFKGFEDEGKRKRSRRNHATLLPILAGSLISFFCYLR